MKPTLVIVGRPNVGKSTLFNRLTRSRDALVADLPGLTRDRHYGIGRLGSRDYLLVDTGGFEPATRDPMLHLMARQAEAAIAEGDVLLFMVDARAGLTPLDQAIAVRLRSARGRLVLVVNKAEGMNRDLVAAEFHELGCGHPLVISAAHGDAVHDLVDFALSGFAPEVEEVASAEHGPKVAIVGRPNVGKSTLVNTLLGEERVIVFDQPGTTRDAIETAFERNGKCYTLIDTAGLRKRGRVFESVEKFSAIKTLQAIAAAQVAVLVVDGSQEISEQDAHIAGFIAEAGRALVVAVNKWDAADAHQRERIKAELQRKLGFLSFARVLYICALHAEGITALLRAVDGAYAAAMSRMPTPKLTRALQAAVAKQAPPRHGVFRPKLRYAHQGGMNPPRIIIHGNALQHVSDPYRRYLERAFMEAFKLQGTPLKIEFRTSRNPYAN